jgi:hypothetical protein
MDIIYSFHLEGLPMVIQFIMSTNSSKCIALPITLDIQSIIVTLSESLVSRSYFGIRICDSDEVRKESDADLKQKEPDPVQNLLLV